MDASLVIFGIEGDKVWRSRPLRSDAAGCLDVALKEHRAHPLLAIGLFEDASGEAGEAWFFYPELV
jgi:hypothetical protein